MQSILLILKENLNVFSVPFVTRLSQVFFFLLIFFWQRPFSIQIFFFRVRLPLTLYRMLLSSLNN